MLPGSIWIPLLQIFCYFYMYCYGFYFDMILVIITSISIYSLVFPFILALSILPNPTITTKWLHQMREWKWELAQFRSFIQKIKLPTELYAKARLIFAIYQVQGWLEIIIRLSKSQPGGSYINNILYKILCNINVYFRIHNHLFYKE